MPSNSARTTSDAKSDASVGLGLHRIYKSCKWRDVPLAYRFTPLRNKLMLFGGLQRCYTNTAFAVVDFDTFRANFRALTRGMFEYVDWTNLIVAGGAILACLTHPSLTVPSCSPDSIAHLCADKSSASCLSTARLRYLRGWARRKSCRSQNDSSLCFIMQGWRCQVCS